MFDIYEEIGIDESGQKTCRTVKLIADEKRGEEIKFEIRESFEIFIYFVIIGKTSF